MTALPDKLRCKHQLNKSAVIPKILRLSLQHGGIFPQRLCLLREILVTLFVAKKVSHGGTERNIL
jgi:hypothetical protein